MVSARTAKAEIFEGRKGRITMKKSEAKKAMFTRLSAEALKGSTAERYAMSMKGVEAVIRNAIYVHMSADDWRARSANRADLIIYGKRSDVKCGGTVASGKHVYNWTVDDLIAGNAYIVFPVIDRIFDEDDALDNAAIFTREEFFEICENASRKGLAGTFHITGGNTRSAVVAFQPTPLRKVRDMVWEMLEHGEVLTVRQYIIEKEEARG